MESKNEKLKTKLNKKGDIIYFDYDHFKNLYNDENTCFICGVSNKYGAEFNNEHIIPNWIVKHFNLANKKIKLTNEQLWYYSRYKIPCCKKCNDQLSTIYENPISELFKLSYSQVSNIFLEDLDIRTKVFRWLSVIYSKSYFSKRQFRINLDKRLKEDKITSILNPNNLHHIHCIARSHFTNAEISPNTYGTLILGHSSDLNSFDYCDDKNSSTIMLKLGDKFLIAVLDDSGAIKELLGNPLAKLQGKSLNNFQIRELFTWVSYTNFNLKVRPEYFSYYYEESDRYKIDVRVPNTWELIPYNEIKYTYEKLLAFFIEQLLPPKHPIIKKILDGKWGFLFDDKGEFYEEKIDLNNKNL